MQKFFDSLWKVGKESSVMSVMVIQPDSYEAALQQGWTLDGVYPRVPETQKRFEVLEHEFAQVALSFFDGEGKPVSSEHVAFWTNNTSSL